MKLEKWLARLSYEEKKAFEIIHNEMLEKTQENERKLRLYNDILTTLFKLDMCKVRNKNTVEIQTLRQKMYNFMMFKKRANELKNEILEKEVNVSQITDYFFSDNHDFDTLFKLNEAFKS